MGHVSEVSAKKQHASLGLGGGFKHFFSNFHPDPWGNDSTYQKSRREKHMFF